jgi:hypothetical protein
MDSLIAKVLVLHEEAIRRLPEIEARIGKGNPLAYSIAKYWPALDRLAKE